MKTYFLHIPKTAGTSTIDWLSSCGAFNACPIGLWSLLLEAGRDAVEPFDLYQGHYYRYLSQYLAAPLQTFTFLRNPIDRAYSHYRHVVRDPYHYFHDRAKRHESFLEFMLDPVTQPLVRNFQTRALSAIFDPVALRESQTEAPQHPRWLEQHLETTPSGLSEEEELLLAKDFLHRCFFVGIVEHMEESIARLAAALQVRPSGGIKHLNRDAGVAHRELTAREWQTAVQLNRADLDLYSYALGMFHLQRGALPPNGPR